MEWSFIFPLFLLTCFAVLEIGLMLFVIGSAEFTAGEAARVLATAGNVSDADTQALLQLNSSTFGSSSIGVVKTLTIAHVDAQGAQIGNQFDRWSKRPGPTPPCQVGWCPVDVGWTAPVRKVGLGCSDYFRVTIAYEYGPKTALFGRALPIQLTASRIGRLEPNQPSC